MRRELLYLSFLLSRTNHMSIELHGMGDPVHMLLGLFSTLSQQDLVQRPTRQNGVDHFTVHRVGGLSESCPGCRATLLSNLQLKNGLTGYSHPGSQLFGGHSQGLAEGADPAVRRSLQRPKLADFFEPFVELAKLNQAKLFSHIEL